MELCFSFKKILKKDTVLVIADENLHVFQCRKVILAIPPSQLSSFFVAYYFITIARDVISSI